MLFSHTSADYEEKSEHRGTSMRFNPLGFIRNSKRRPATIAANLRKTRIIIPLVLESPPRETVGYPVNNLNRQLS